MKYKKYTIKIEQDESPSNPFEEWDCEPALLVYSYDHHRGRLDTYQNAPENLADIIRLLPDTMFARGNRVRIIKGHLPDCSLKEFADFKRYHGYDSRDAFAEWLTDRMGATPEGWRSADYWFNTVDVILKEAGIACHNTESHGYSQGDTVKLLAIATPAWAELVGAPADSLEKQCESACKLYGAWVWGDVYGIAKILDPNGEEIEDGSVWSFYGSDHDASGLMESARGIIEYHIARTARVKTIARQMCLA